MEKVRKTLSFDTLYHLCNKHKWFTGGDFSQYDKLFDKNRQGASLETLATIIWLCSSMQWTEEKILKILREAQKNESDESDE